MMQPLSAADALSPAWRHTRELLFSPRRFSTFLKVAAVGFFAQIGGCNTSLHNLSNQKQHIPPHMMLLVASFAMTFLVIALLLSLVFFYLGSRLQFVRFEVVLRRDTTITPIWSRYGAATWRWMGLKLLYFLLVLICVAPILVPFLIHFIHNAPQGQAAPAELIHFVASFMGFFALMFLVSIVFGAIYHLLADFGLPSMALESTTLGETVARVGRLLRAEPGQVILYAFLRMVLGFGLTIAGELAIAVAAVIALIPFGGGGFMLWKFLAHGDITGKIFFGFGVAILGIIYVALVLCAVVMTFGYIFLFLQAYALFFLAGRYPLVGQYMEQYLQQPVYPPAQPWQPGLYTPPPA